MADTFGLLTRGPVLTLVVALATVLPSAAEDANPAEPPTPPTAAAEEKPAGETVTLKRRDADRPRRTRGSEADTAKPDAAPPAAEDRGLPSLDDMPAKPSALDVEMLDKIDQAVVSVPDEAEDPLLRVGNRMRQVEGQLARAAADSTTLQTQEQILKDLDELLKQAEAQCKSGQCANPSQSQSPQNQQQQAQQNQNQQQQQAKPQPVKTVQQLLEQMQQAEKPGSKPSQPGNQQGTQPGKPADATVVGGRTNLREDLWGHLGANLRQEMSQYVREDFLPGYRSLIERYYESVAKQSRASNE